MPTITLKKDRLSYMTTSHITAELAPLAVSLCSFSSWFASHMHILHSLDSMFTSVPARAKTPTQTGSILSWSRAFLHQFLCKTGAMPSDVAMHGGATMRAKGLSGGWSDHSCSESDTRQPCCLVVPFCLASCLLQSVFKPSGHLKWFY